MTDTGHEFWRGKRVLLTGHSGFKGSWLTLWLHRLGAEVTGISLPPVTDPNLFTLCRIEDLCQSNFCDIRRPEELRFLITAAAPQIVIHMAAQPLVRTSYLRPLETFDTNVMGTANLLEAIRGLPSVKVAVMVTTDKVYHNAERARPYVEDDRLGSSDPYSASKAASELVITSYRDSYLDEQGVALASARAGNVIGGGDWSEYRLIPDAIRAWEAGKVLDIRCPDAVRPWQHVLDPLFGYITLAECLWHKPALAGAYNFGPGADAAARVRDVIKIASDYYGSASVRYGNDIEGPHEANLLTLDSGKSMTKLGVTSRIGLLDTVRSTVDWYRALGRGADASELCLAEITSYQESL